MLNNFKKAIKDGICFTSSVNLIVTNQHVLFIHFQGLAGMLDKQGDLLSSEKAADVYTHLIDLNSR